MGSGVWAASLSISVGSLAQEASVGVGADGVAAAGAAVVLPMGGCSVLVDLQARVQQEPAALI